MPLELYMIGCAGLALFGFILYRCVGLRGVREPEDTAALRVSEHA